MYNCGEVAHLSNGNNDFPISGDYLHERENLVNPPGMCIMIDDSVISKIGPMEDLLTEYAPWYPVKSENSDTSKKPENKDLNKNKTETENKEEV